MPDSMDIEKWLSETELPCPLPSLPDKIELAPSSHPGKPRQAVKKGRIRKRSASDSSLLQISRLRRKIPPIEKDPEVEASAEESVCSHASRNTKKLPSESSTSDHRYARRPRRKTRPERYDPIAKDGKKRGRHVHGGQNGESKRTKRKTRRKRSSKQGSGIPQNFHAKNVHRDRLTLKPSEKLGIFNRGKASTPVKGRGLPDLVFSEMKFLQKHRDQPEVEREPRVSKRRKKDHTHAKEEEISAYFTSVRPALAQRDVNTQAKGGIQKKDVVPEMDHECERSSVRDNATPTVESSDKVPYLGFGSRGPRHESDGYISWSESIRAPSATSRCQKDSTADVGQLNSRKGDVEGENTSGMKDTLHTHSQADLLDSTRLTKDDSGERFDVSSLTQEFHRFSRSHSYPQHECSTRRIDHFGQTENNQTYRTEASSSSLPPILPSLAHTNDRRRPLDPKTSPPFASASLLEYRPESEIVDARRVARDLQAPVVDESNFESALRPYSSIQRMPTVRSASVNAWRPRIPDICGPSIYEQQEQRLQTQLDEDTFAREPCFIASDRNIPVNHNGELEVWTSLELGTNQYQMDNDGVVEDLLRQNTVEYGHHIVEPSDRVVGTGFWRPHRLY